MSYTTTDTSTADAQACALYQIDRSATVIWRYTNADQPIEYAGHTWSPQPISDDGTRLTGQATADTLRLTLPADLPVVQLFRGTPPSAEIFVTIFDYDAGAKDGEVRWIGSISDAAWTEPGQAELMCDSLSASMQREGLRLRYERSCPHSIFDGQCALGKEDHGLDCRIAELDGQAVRVLRVDFSTANVLETDDTPGAERLRIDVVNPSLYVGGRIRGGVEEHQIASIDADGWVTSSDGLAAMLSEETVEIVPAMEAESFIYGAIAWAVEGTQESRGLDAVDDDSLAVLGGTFGLTVGLAVTLYPGCDGTRVTCHNRYNNLLNHGGFPHMPGESIFGKRLW